MKTRFTVRTLLVLTTVIAIFVVTWVNRAERQRLAVLDILEAGGWVYYGESLNELNVTNSTLGVHMLHDVKLVTLRPTDDFPTDLQLDLLADLPRLEQLTIWPGGNATSLDLRSGAGLTDLGANKIAKNHKRLKHLGVTAADCSDDALDMLEYELPNADYIHVKMRDPQREQRLLKR